MSGDTSSGWKGGSIERKCQECGELFFVKLSHTKNGRGLFCSQKCFGRNLSKKRRGKKHPRWKGGLVEQECQECGGIFLIKPIILKNCGGKFCSRKCQGIARSKNNRGINNPSWKGGISFEPYCHKFNEEFKQYIRTKFGNVCFLCGKTEEENGRKLSVHHVNYDKNCGCAETEKNRKVDDEKCQFVPLCISCNSRVNKNRSLWELRIKNMMKNKLNGWYI